MQERPQILSRSDHMLFIFINILLSVVFAGLIHELGHYAAALCYGERLKFTFTWGRLFGRIPIPRWIWYMPTRLPLCDKRIIAGAGFGFEVFAGFPLLSAGLYAYPIVVLLHIALYPFYAGNSSDFKWFAKKREA
jgi:hypothetical protein